PRRAPATPPLPAPATEASPRTRVRSTTLGGSSTAVDPSRGPSTPMSPQRVISTSRAAAAVLGLALAAWAGWGSPRWWSIPALVLAMAVSDAASVRVVLGRQSFSFGLYDAVAAVVFVLAPGAWIAAAAVLAYALPKIGRLPWVK